MAKKFILLIFLVSSMLFSGCYPSVQGNIYNQSDEPVQGISVQLKNGTEVKTTSTDADGLFKFEELTQDTVYTIEILQNNIYPPMREHTQTLPVLMTTEPFYYITRDPEYRNIGCGIYEGINTTIEGYGKAPEGCTHFIATCRGKWFFNGVDWDSDCTSGWEYDSSDYYQVNEEMCSSCEKYTAKGRIKFYNINSTQIDTTSPKKVFIEWLGEDHDAGGVFWTEADGSFEFDLNSVGIDDYYAVRISPYADRLDNPMEFPNRSTTNTLHILSDISPVKYKDNVTGSTNFDKSFGIYIDLKEDGPVLEEITASAYTGGRVLVNLNKDLSDSRHAVYIEKETNDGSWELVEKTSYTGTGYKSSRPLFMKGETRARIRVSSSGYSPAVIINTLGFNSDLAYADLYPDPEPLTTLIEGTISRDNGDPISGITVEIYSEYRELEQSVTTNSDGYYQSGLSLADGTYSIEPLVRSYNFSPTRRSADVSSTQTVVADFEGETNTGDKFGDQAWTTGAVPSGWVITDILNDRKLIRCIANATRGYQITIDPSSRIPSDWVVTNDLINGDKLITYVDGYECGKNLTVALSSPVPNYWTVTQTTSNVKVIKKICN